MHFENDGYSTIGLKLFSKHLISKSHHLFQCEIMNKGVLKLPIHLKLSPILVLTNKHKSEFVIGF